ncbi:MAG TPA: hypothetical protein VG104_07880 [Candidatus Dormibacteraeota bacterium]|jgi:hypothetical protein|nr:hypothetical protein [Candidatus Dormibacteraeota bacterium]
MNQGLLKYLYSTKNIVGSALALVGLVLFFTGIIGPLWPVIVVGLYLIGALVGPGTPSIDLRSGFDPNDVRKALDNEVRIVNGRVPADVLAKVQSIQQIILGILPRSGALPAGSPELFVVQRTATDYLPTSLESYLNLPRAYATLHPVQDGKTPKQVLLDQLTLLESKMTEVADDVHRNDTDRLLANGRFLEERFGRSPLSLEGPAASSQ